VDPHQRPQPSIKLRRGHDIWLQARQNFDVTHQQRINRTKQHHWVIGDVHGCYQSLLKLLAVLPNNDHLVFCGDLINRGAGIEASMSTVWEQVHQGRATWLRGNHEQRLINHLESTSDLNQAELTTIDTYQQLGDKLTRQWLKRLRTLPLTYQSKGWIATHAGLNAQGDADLCVRKPFWEHYDGRYGLAVIGHTPQPDVVRQNNIVMIDTGACYGGLLTAYCPESDAVVQVLGEQIAKRLGDKLGEQRREQRGEALPEQRSDALLSDPFRSDPDRTVPFRSGQINKTSTLLREASTPSPRLSAEPC